MGHAAGRAGTQIHPHPLPQALVSGLAIPLRRPGLALQQKGRGWIDVTELRRHADGRRLRATTAASSG